MINAQVDDLSSRNTKYTSPTLTKKVFANIRRIGKGFLGVDTPLFDGMLVQQQVQDVKDAVEDKNDDNEVSAEPTPPSPRPTCATLTKQVANLEQDKIAQAIEITKLKQRVRRLEKKRQFKCLGLKRLRKGGIAELDADEDVTLEDIDDTNEAEPAKVEEVIEVVTAAKLITEVVTTASTTITDAQVPKASAPRRRKGVVIHDPEETATAVVIVNSEVKSKDKGKGILIEEPKPLKRQEQIKQDEAFARQLEVILMLILNGMMKNVMVYLKNMAGFKIDFFRGMTYNEIRPIIENHYNLNQAFLERVKEEVRGQKEEGSKRKGDNINQDAAKKKRIDEEEDELQIHLHIVVNDDDDVYTEATPLELKVLIVDYQIHHESNKPFYKIIRADGTHKLFLSFITFLKNFDREDLEMLWKLVQERFQFSEPKNFSDDFLLNTFKTMFEKPNVKGNIWRDQKGIYGLAKVNSWKLFEYYGVHIITLITTQMILLVEKKYLLTRFTLEQMLNNVRLEVEEESKMSLELLRDPILNTFFVVSRSIMLNDRSSVLFFFVKIYKDKEIFFAGRDASSSPYGLSSNKSILDLSASSVSFALSFDLSELEE
nr:hypothetical protein [Tanacetum cinerariifolium]